MMINSHKPRIETVLAEKIAVVVSIRPKEHAHTLIAPLWGLSSLAKELPAAASVMRSSSKELSTLVADKVLKKMLTKAAAAVSKNKNTLKFP